MWRDRATHYQKHTSVSLSRSEVESLISLFVRFEGNPILPKKAKTRFFPLETRFSPMKLGFLDFAQILNYQI